jgi:hypothetical protein
MIMARGDFAITILITVLHPCTISSSSVPPEPSSDSSARCAICLEALFARNVSISTLPCEHEFHKDCIYDWVGRAQSTCPMCRGHVGSLLEAAVTKRTRSGGLHIMIMIVLWFCVLSLTATKLVSQSPVVKPSVQVVLASILGLLFWLLVLFAKRFPMREDMEPLFDLLHR